MTSAPPPDRKANPQAGAARTARPPGEGPLPRASGNSSIPRASGDSSIPRASGNSSIPRASGATPAMAQWFAAKATHPEAIVFFRMGDFYEMFFEDAEAASAALDIALSFRGEHQGERVPMCGVPAHAHEAYLARLIRQGFRVALCDQMETPEEAKARRAPTLRREVVRLVTPGTVTEEALLEARRPAWLLALAPAGERLGAAWLDVTTGAFGTESLAAADLPALLARLEPAEILAPEALARGPALATLGARIAHAEPPRDGAAPRRGSLCRRDHRGLRHLRAGGGRRRRHGARLRSADPGRRACRASPRRCRSGGRGLLQMDGATRRSLEILRSERGDPRHALLAAVRSHRHARRVARIWPRALPRRSPMPARSARATMRWASCWRPRPCALACAPR